MTRRKGSPPKLPMILLRLVVPKDVRGESIIGDVREDWEARSTAGGARRTIWFWWVASALATEILIGRLLRGVRRPSSTSEASLLIEQTIQDVRLALRHMARQPLFTVVAVGSLAVGIGANTAIFSVVNRLFLRPLGGMNGTELIVELGSTREGSGFDTFSYPEVMELRAQTATFSHVAAWYPEEMSHAPSDQIGGEHILSFFVSANYFSTLGVVPARGRFFAPAEDEGVGEHPVVVVSDRFWRRALGSDPDAVGTSLRLNREPYTIVGIAPATFGSHVVGLHPDVFVPMMQSSELRGSPDRLRNWNSMWAVALARLAPSTAPEEADAVVRTLFRRLETDRARSNEGRGARALPLGPVPGGGRALTRNFLLALTGLVSLVLLVTCANLAGMVLARSAARAKEIAMRLALGSSRARMVRYLATEALVLFMVGGTLGVLLAYWGLGQVDLTTLPIPFPFDPDFSVDLRVLGFALAVTLITGALFGTLPALRTSRADLVSALKNGHTDIGGANRLRGVFVSGQVAFSVVLLASAGLFLRSLQEAGQLASGFEPEGLVMTSFDLSREGYGQPEAVYSFQVRLLEQIASIPGARGAALSADLPLDMTARGTSAVIDQGDPTDERNRIAVDFNAVSKDYFSVLGIPVLQGRPFGPQDGTGSTAVVLVSRTLAERAWPNEDPIGRTLTLQMGSGVAQTVIGVVEDVRNVSLTEVARPMVYSSLTQLHRPDVILTAALPGGLESAGPLLLDAVRQVDPSIATTAVATVTRYTGVGTLPQRIAASLTSGLGLLALFLSALGIYGIIAFSVAQRSREIGIRMALGARRGDVRLRVMRGALRLSLPGVAAGALLVFAAGPLLSALLIGVSPTDPLTLGSVVALFVVIIGLASLIPARRASAIDPMDALRCE